MAHKKRNNGEPGEETPHDLDPELDPEIAPWLDRYEQTKGMVPHERMYRFSGPRGEIRLISVETLYMAPGAWARDPRSKDPLWAFNYISPRMIAAVRVCMS
jgi:hypothetical protein